MNREPGDLGGLANNPFDYRITHSGEIHVSRGGRTVTVVRGQTAAKLATQLGQDPAADQLLLAKATGNYRRGNERR